MKFNLAIFALYTLVVFGLVVVTEDFRHVNKATHTVAHTHVQQKHLNAIASLEYYHAAEHNIRQKQVTKAH